jgi:hypothetical protein
MADIHYELFLNTPERRRISALPTTFGLSYTLKLNDVGVLKMTLPAEMRPLFQEDSIIDVWRNGERLPVNTFWLARRFTRRTDRDGRELMDVTAVNGTHILKRRIVGYKAGTTQAGSSLRISPTTW